MAHKRGKQRLRNLIKSYEHPTRLDAQAPFRKGRQTIANHCDRPNDGPDFPLKPDNYRGAGRSYDGCSEPTPCLRAAEKWVTIRENQPAVDWAIESSA